MKAFGYAAQSKSTPLGPYSFERREPAPNDVVVAIDYCGICHSDIHQARGEWGAELFPMVPGHEIVGHVTAVGSDVTRFKVGDAAAVGVIVESCLHCNHLQGRSRGVLLGWRRARDTYNAVLRSGERTMGGYSDVIVTPEHFVHHAEAGDRSRCDGAAAVRGHHDVLPRCGTGAWGRTRRWAWSA